MSIQRLQKLFKIGKLAAANPKYFFILMRFRAFTMVPHISYFHNLKIASEIRNKKGSVVECGTWKGGMIAGIAQVMGADHEYYLFDSYEGLPPVTEKDGESAAAWQNNVSSGLFYDNCLASVNDARSAMSKAGINAPNIIKGWFEDTLPGIEIPGGIALLRMDGDWYDSTMQILKNLFPQVLPGGLIIIDDYYTWDGCTRAVHDYLSEEKRSERIQSFHGVCYIIKN